MALGPLGPGPERKDDLRIESRLVDRAHFLGDTARHSRTRGPEPTPSEATSFQKALKKRLAGDSAEEEEESPSASGADIGEALHHEPQARDPLQEPTASAELESRLQGQEEGEKFSAGAGAWRGPNPLFGLALLTGAGPVLAGAVTAGEQSRSEQPEQEVEEVGAGGARVDPGLLVNLEEAGLKRPLRGLDDPRLAGSRPALEAEDGWRSGPVPGGVGYTWEAPGRSAYQRLEWSDLRTLLESAAGSTLQILERKGTQLSVRLKRRTPPAPTTFRVDS